MADLLQSSDHLKSSLHGNFTNGIWHWSCRSLTTIYTYSALQSMYSTVPIHGNSKMISRTLLYLSWMYMLPFLRIWYGTSLILGKYHTNNHAILLAEFLYQPSQALSRVITWWSTILICGVLVLVMPSSLKWSFPQGFKEEHPSSWT